MSEDKAIESGRPQLCNPLLAFRRVKVNQSNSVRHRKAALHHGTR